jgi:hypothetical protein
MGISIQGLKVSGNPEPELSCPISLLQSVARHIPTRKL